MRWRRLTRPAASWAGPPRNELERLVADRPSDIVVLQQCVGLAEKEGDLTELRLRFQRQLATVSRDSHDHLVGLLLQLGEIDEAMQLWQHEAAAAKGLKRLLELTDNLLFYKQAERALPTVARALATTRATGRRCIAKGSRWPSSNEPTRPPQRFQAILDLRLPDNQLSALISPGDGAPLAEGSILDSITKDAERRLHRLDAVPLIRQAVGVDPATSSERPFGRPAISARPGLPR